MSGLTHYPVATALSIHQHIQHPGTGHVCTAGNEGRITLCVACSIYRDSGSNHLFLLPLLSSLVRSYPCVMFTSQPCVNYGGVHLPYRSRYIIIGTVSSKITLVILFQIFIKIVQFRMRKGHLIEALWGSWKIKKFENLKNCPEG